MSRFKHDSVFGSIVCTKSCFFLFFMLIYCYNQIYYYLTKGALKIMEKIKKNLSDLPFFLFGAIYFHYVQQIYAPHIEDVSVTLIPATASAILWALVCHCITQTIVSFAEILDKTNNS